VSMNGEAGNPHTGLEIGKTLRLAREKRGLSLQQVEEATKIRTRYLRDLENEHFDVLPAVYMLGSLKTYAEHVGLDGAVITRELKRHLASPQQEQEQAAEDPSSGEPRGFLASLGRFVGISGTVEDEAGTMAPVRSPGLYVSLAVVLIFVLATYLASSIRGEDPPSVSVVQKPKVSQLPSGFALVGNVEDEERNTEDLNKENQPKNEAESPTVDTGNDERTRAERSGLEEYPSGTARVPSSATVFASVSAASTGSASPSVTATPPTRVRPDPPASEQPGERDMAAPGGPRARVSGSQSLYETQAGPVDATQLGDRVPNKVKKAVDSAW
jgi:transcriptional regulator with XRE-family HTH domain